MSSLIGPQERRSTSFRPPYLTEEGQGKRKQRKWGARGNAKWYTKESSITKLHANRAAGAEEGGLKSVTAMHPGFRTNDSTSRLAASDIR